MSHEPDRNRRLTVALLAGAVLLPAVVALVIGLVVGFVAGNLVIPVVLVAFGFAVGAVLAATAWKRALASVLRGVGARPVRAGSGAEPPAGGRPDPVVQRLENLVDGLCAASGLPVPSLHLVDDDAPGALVAGVRAQDAAVVVTSGLLGALTRVELEGVVGHLLARIRRQDIVPATLAAVLLGPLAAKVTPPTVALDADAAAVAITRYPPGLAAALAKLRNDPRPVERAPRASLALWVAPPAARDADPDLDHRIAVLREL